MRTIMDKINHFESLAETTVEKFNEIFPECPIECANAKAVVEIGECLTPETARKILVDGTEMRHSFVREPVLIEEGDYNWRNEVNTTFVEKKQRSHAGKPQTSPSERLQFKYPTNEDVEENAMLGKEEIALGPSQYFILQYLRGCRSEYHTYAEIGRNLGIHKNTAIRILNEMNGAGIVKLTTVVDKLRIKVELAEKWS